MKLNRKNIVFYSPYFGLFLLFIILIFSEMGCQTEIDVTPLDYYDKIVIEGYIENGKPASVTVMKSVPYFSEIDVNHLMTEVFIQDAHVSVISEDGESENLTMQINPEAPFYSAYTGSKLLGKCNTTYTLRVECRGHVYTATTRILEPFDLDSIWFAKVPGILSDSSANIRFALTDNPAQTNYYQFRVKIHCKDFTDRLWVNTLPVAFDDILMSGSSFEYDLVRANPSVLLLPSMSDEELSEYMRPVYRIGDTVYVQYAQIDYDSYRFWSSANSEILMGQNPFLNPIPVISNIHSEDGKEALGIWCGYAARTQMMILK